jgi:hypothetical protein
MERVDSLWFPDGNLVLSAHGVLFRVFKGILAARSPVFADMLAFPQPEDAETLDGCPVLHLDDSAADTMYFLKALFDYEYVHPSFFVVPFLGEGYRELVLGARSGRGTDSLPPRCGNCTESEVAVG